MSNDYNFDPCDYPDCSDDGVRHLCTYHFCDEHRQAILDRAGIEGVSDLFGFVARVVQQ